MCTKHKPERVRRDGRGRREAEEGGMSRKLMDSDGDEGCWESVSPLGVV
jgi:hypothetical protein